MYDPLKHKAVRVVVDVQNENGNWTDAAVIPMERRGPDSAFSSGAVGFYAGTNIAVHGRPGRIGVTFTETGSKGYGTPRPKGGDPDARKAGATAAVASYYDEPAETLATTGRARRTA